MAHAQPVKAAPYRYLLLLLFCGYALSFADRVVFSLVLKPIKLALVLTDSRAGLLAGAGFAITYALFAPVGGFFIDRFRRTLIFAFAVTFWSCGSFASGVVTTQLGMMLCRASVGMGEALFLPLAVSLLADTVPLALRARAMAIFFSAGSVGSLGVSLIGGILLQVLSRRHLSLPLIGTVQPWQSLFMLLAVPGFLLALLVLLTMREPARTAVPLQVAGGHTQTVGGFFRDNRRLALTLLLGYPLLQMASQAVTNWTFIFLDRVYGLPAGKAGVLTAGTAGLTSIVGAVMGGPFVGLLRRRGYVDASLRACCLGGLLFSGLAVIGLLMPTLVLSLLFSSLAFLFSYTPTVGAFAAISEVAPPGIRAALAGAVTLTLGLLNASLGPWLVGLFSDRLFAYPTGIRASLVSVCLISAVVGGSLVALGLKPFGRLLSATTSPEKVPLAAPLPVDTL